MDIEGKSTSLNAAGLEGALRDLQGARDVAGGGDGRGTSKKQRRTAVSVAVAVAVVVGFATVALLKRRRG